MRFNGFLLTTYVIVKDLQICLWISYFPFYQVLLQHSANLYAANGAGVVLAEKGHFDVSKDLFTQVS